MVRAEEGQEQSENYLEDMKSQEEAKMKKKLKKARQAEKRANMIQENIPAVVTIRRVPGGENGTPSVTITLKGCTPVQDKLLTKLVEPKVEVQNLIFESNQALPPDPKGICFNYCFVFFTHIILNHFVICFLIVAQVDVSIIWLIMHEVSIWFSRFSIIGTQLS